MVANNKHKINIKELEIQMEKDRDREVMELKSDIEDKIKRALKYGRDYFFIDGSDFLIAKQFGLISEEWYVPDDNVPVGGGSVYFRNTIKAKTDHDKFNKIWNTVFMFIICAVIGVAYLAFTN